MTDKLQLMLINIF